MYPLSMYPLSSECAACLLQCRDLCLLVDHGGRANEVVEEDRHAYLPCMRAEYSLKHIGAHMRTHTHTHEEQASHRLSGPADTCFKVLTLPNKALPGQTFHPCQPMGLKRHKTIANRKSEHRVSTAGPARIGLSVYAAILP
jgi:hypothetical protein